MTQRERARRRGARSAVLVATLLVALAIARAAAAQDRTEGPLLLDDVLTMHEIGVDETALIAAARARGLLTAWSPPVEAALSRRGIGPDARAALRAEAGRREVAAPPAGALVTDARADVTWFVPADWSFRPHDGGGAFSCGLVPPGTELTMTFDVLDLPTRRLAASGIDDLGAFHDLRVGEIAREKKEAGWTLRGRWPLAALGWTGSHAVFEADLEGDRKLTFCLTWFARGDRLISLVTRLVESAARPRHDELVDAITRVLTLHVPGPCDEPAWRALHALRADAAWLVLDAEDRPARFDRATGRLAPLGVEKARAAVCDETFETVIVLGEDGLRCLRGELPEAATEGLARADRDLVPDDLEVLPGLRELLVQGRDHRGAPAARLVDLVGGKAAAVVAAEPRSGALDAPTFGPGRAEPVWPLGVEDALTFAGPGGKSDLLARPLLVEPGLVRASLATLEGGAALLGVTAGGDDAPARVVLARLRDGGGRELWRGRAGDVDGAAPRLEVSAGEREFVISLPGRGVFVMPVDGGLPIMILEAARGRDARVVR